MSVLTIMTNFAHLVDHPMLEWTKTLDMWKIADKHCALCAKMRRIVPADAYKFVIPKHDKIAKDLVKVGGIGAILCYDCITFGLSHPNKFISSEDVVTIRGNTTRNGHFSFPQDLKVLDHGINWGASIAKSIGRTGELETFQT